MPIFKRTGKVYKKGHFSKAKYDSWLLKNGGEAELLLSKLGSSDWSEKLDGSDSIEIEKADGETAMFLHTRNPVRLERFRILPEWVEWRKGS